MKIIKNRSLKPKLLLVWFGSILLLLVILGLAQSYFVRQFHINSLQKYFDSSFFVMQQTLEFYINETSMSANQLRSDTDLINSVSLIHSYQDKKDYQEIVFDVEKETLTSILSQLKLLKGIDTVAIFDNDQDLTAFYHASKNSPSSSGYSNYSHGKLQLKILTGDDLDFSFTKNSDEYELLKKIKPTIKVDQLSVTQIIAHEYVSLVITTPIYRDAKIDSREIIGSLVVTRLFDETIITQISELTGYPFSYSINGKQWNNINYPQLSFQTILSIDNIPQYNQDKTDKWLIETQSENSVALSRWKFSEEIQPFLIFSITSSEWLSQLESMKYALIIALGSIIFILLPFTLWMLRKVILIPLEQMYHAVNDIPQGTYPKLPYENRKDEFGLFASALNHMSTGLQQRDLELNASVTQLKKSESELIKKSNQLEELNENLEHRVNQRTDELSQANNKLNDLLDKLTLSQNELIESGKMASLGGLVAGIAHEINTPIGIGLTGMSHFEEEIKIISTKYRDGNLAENDFKNFLQDGAELSRTILSSLQHAAKQIRSFKRVAVDQSQTDIYTFSLKEYFEEVMLSLHNLLKQTKHRVIIDIDEGLLITSDPGSFAQIITNMVTNSLLHAFHNIDAGEITISAIEQGKKIIVNYKDNGVGIPVEHQKKIFDPFFTTKRNEGGTGLGLNIIYNIVTSQLSGSVKVHHPDSGGVNFSFSFPIEITNKPKIIS